MKRYKIIKIYYYFSSNYITKIDLYLNTYLIKITAIFILLYNYTVFIRDLFYIKLSSFFRSFYIMVFNKSDFLRVAENQFKFCKAKLKLTII